jgi:hypothetical protein
MALMEERVIKRFTRLRSPSGTRWTVIKKWSYPGVVWYKVQSDAGRIQNKLLFEMEDWEII